MTGRTKMNTTRCLALFALAILMGLGGGCARKPTAAKAGPLSQAELDSMIKNQAVQDPYLRSQVDYGLEARRTPAGHIQATVVNKTKNPIVVGPKCFGLIVAGRRAVIPATAATLKLFPLAKVAAGEQVSGELAFPMNPIPDGARLVFMQPESHPAMAAVQ